MAGHAKERRELVAGGTWRADRHAGLVDAQGVAGVEHDSVLWNQLAQWQDRFDEAVADVAANGPTMDSKGQVVQNPAAKMMKDASAEIRELCKILGIGPLNRSRLGVGGSDEDDEPVDAPPRKRS
jgi:P27 family predicted phage terminase small subunit